MSEKDKLDDFMSQYLALAAKSKAENKMIFNHVCVRVENIERAQTLLSESFGLDAFLQPGGDTFDQEKSFSVCWLKENNMYLELSEFEQAQTIGYDTGVGQPIGHLSELGFFVPDMSLAIEGLKPKGWCITSEVNTEQAKMYKLNHTEQPGLPIELIDYSIQD